MYNVLATPDLAPGMIVHCHGGRFRLTECFHDADTAARRAEALVQHNGGRATPRTPDVLAVEVERERSLCAFKTVYLGPVDGAACDIPAGWIPDWTVQGNHNARWRVEVAA